jgi:predicted metalloprotease with PDZ domain
MQNLKPFLLILTLWLGIQPANAMSEDSIRYSIQTQQAALHRIEISMQVPTQGRDSIELSMPAWTPGSYLIREYARHIESISARDPKSDQPLTLDKLDKDTWRVDCGQTETVEVRYQLYCREMSVRTNWVETEYAFLTGAGTFLTDRELANIEHVVSIDRPASWPDVATSLKTSRQGNQIVCTAETFDVLVDSPILLGNVNDQQFVVGGKTHHLASVGGNGLWDFTTASDDVAKLVETEQLFWGNVPYEEYWFLNIISGSGGGLEHDNSCVLMANRWVTRDRDSYVGWLSLVSHEFFHTWNVRRLRPKQLRTYEYSREQNFPELWIAEGVTSYFDDLIVAKSGLMNDSEYLARLSKTIEAVQTAPGRLNQSLYDSSFDAWTKLYRPDENTRNSRISYYSKGSLVAALLDVHLQDLSQGTVDLRSVMVELWSRYSETGYTLEDFENLCGELVREDLSGWFDRHIRSAEELNFDPLLARYGLEWKAASDNSTGPTGSTSNEDNADEAETATDERSPGDAEKAESGDDETLDPAKEWKRSNAFGKTFVGFETDDRSGNVYVRTVLLGTPAAVAGFNAGDEIVAVDGLRMSSSEWAKLLRLRRPDEQLIVTIARHGELKTIQLVLGTQPELSWTLKLSASPTDEQIEHRNTWLGRLSP